MLVGLNDHTTGCVAALSDKSTMANLPRAHRRIRSLDGHQEMDHAVGAENEGEVEGEVEGGGGEEVEEVVVVMVVEEPSYLDEDVDTGTDFMRLVNLMLLASFHRTRCTRSELEGAYNSKVEDSLEDSLMTASHMCLDPLCWHHAIALDDAHDRTHEERKQSVSG